MADGLVTAQVKRHTLRVDALLANVYEVELRLSKVSSASAPWQDPPATESSGVAQGTRNAARCQNATTPRRLKRLEKHRGYS